ALKEACLNQEISQLPGFGKKSEANILTNIDTVLSRPDRYPIDKILKFIDLVEKGIKAFGVKRYDISGSSRRVKETSRDLDFILETDDISGFTEFMIGQAYVINVVSQGEKKLS